ncbi:Bifunctional glutamine synthetase adenylyltransferase/adenylyl-removing enzyme [Usitatibacter rugosus]|uniref:Bifunctional glutamine synthetase adenylyltransferase/adenylyl-removing enzyme n=1 Tax=Usitatibacter rugosus TaxID=2732067 RepID=A0A6M4GWY0_9PROT|nr:bifunctional [glutamate--ammonia ligase]-adenylyl-L-tyrosine phosphorylase/[glutamate--ammonia-ligase] adenylyltransferase [Usitatibacter rugosus]QJR11779.1 Bifunctional glutamine synthetase adenylyltransferase/adenylyl-removing enzyme [Usitatibacter rugosus]
MPASPAALPLAAALERTRRLSRYCDRLLTARPELEAVVERHVAESYSRAEMEAALALDIAPASALRRLRQEVMLVLAHRDLNGLASLDEVLATMSALADTTIAYAAAEAHRATVAVHGEPVDATGCPMRLIVAGLGKLGGGELNVSSDVDLIFLYAEEGETPGPRSVSYHEFFAAAGKRLIALLAEVTDEGQVFRVDMRLRPYGDSGPLVTSLASLEAYFVGQARPWERYAWLKARVISGESEALAALVRPFVYRRYLDYGMLESLRDLHGRISEAAAQRGKSNDIKVGAGGIRESEFAVQLQQMVRGGRELSLQTTSTREALARLIALGLLDTARGTALGTAYAYLRKLEHRLQYYDDQQTQALPEAPEHQAAIAESMDQPDFEALRAELDTHRARIQETFTSLFERPVESGAAVRLGARLNDPQGTPDAEGLAEELGHAGIDSPAALAARLLEFTRARRYQGLSAACRTRVEALLPKIVAAAAREPESSATAIRLLELIEAIDRREAYLALLVEFPQVLARAAHLMARSRWAARLLARHPILLDELTRSAASFTATDWKAERKWLHDAIAQAAGDTERILDLLRHFKQRHVLRLTIADLEGELPVMALSDELSALADLVLDATLAEASASLGFARGGLPGFIVVGYGKLGGKELGYGSDLDIVFLYDESRAEDAEKLARIAQRVNAWLTALTPAGVLYEVDLRLRPDGAKGLFVSSLPAFRDYQLHRAWTWEHQALTRTRFSAGDPALGKRFEALRDELLAIPRDRSKLLADIVSMRAKMRDEHRKSHELKHVPGGIVDLEFGVQAIVLLHGPAHPKLREDKGNHQLLRWAGELGLIDAAVANAAAEAYLALRRRTHAAALNDEEKVIVQDGELKVEREAVEELWRAVFGTP